MIPKCTCCGDDYSLIKDKLYGWVCSSCLEELERVDRETDWDEYEAQKRARIAEGQEE